MIARFFVLQDLKKLEQDVQDRIILRICTRCSIYYYYVYLLKTHTTCYLAHLEQHLKVCIFFRFAFVTQVNDLAQLEHDFQDCIS
jgi:hypothetical protein